MLSGEKLPLVEANGVKLNYKIDGKGKTVIFLHGVGGTLHNFDGITSELSKRARVLRVDMRGFGRSDKPAEKPYSLEVWSDDLHALLSVLKIEDAVVVGHSMGGRIACLFAANYPDQISGLVTLNTTAWGSNPEGAKKLRECLNRLPAEGMKVFLDNAPWLQSLQLKTAEVAKREERETLENDPRSYGFAIETVIKDFTGESDSSFLKQIRCRTLILLGDRDSAPLSGALDMFKQIPNSYLAVVPDSGHFSFYEKPRIVLALLNEFIFDMMRRS